MLFHCAFASQPVSLLYMGFRSSVVASTLWLIAFTSVKGADAVSVLHQLEHAIFLQEIEWRQVEAMSHYQDILSSPTVGAKVSVEARLQLARCYEWRDSPSASKSLYQSIVRLHADATSHVRFANERLRNLDQLTTSTADFPSRHLVAHLSDLLAMLKVSIREPGHPLTKSLVEAMRDGLRNIEEELALAPSNESSAFRNRRRELQAQLTKQRAALSTILDAQASGLQDTAIRIAASDASFSEIRERSRLFDAPTAFGKWLLDGRITWIEAIMSKQADKAALARENLSALLLPLMSGPAGVPEVHLAQALTQTLDLVHREIGVGNWAEAQKLLLSELTSLHLRYRHAPSLVVPSSSELSPPQVARIAGLLTYAADAIEELENGRRSEQISNDLNAMLVDAQRVVVDWHDTPAPRQRLEALIVKIKQARSALTSSPGDALTILQAEVYR